MPKPWDQKNRMMRMIIKASKDDLALSTIWEEQMQSWDSKWKAATFKNAVNDNVAEPRALDVLMAVSQSCK